MLLEKLNAMIYALQHGTYEEFEDVRTVFTGACREADVKLAAQQSVAYCPRIDNSHILKDGELCGECGLPKPPRN